MDQQTASAVLSAIGGAASSLAIPTIGVLGVVLAALLGTRAAAGINADAAVRVAEINAEGQRLLALDASRREWRKHLVQPLLDEMQRRSELYARIDMAARMGDGNTVKTLVDQLGPVALQSRAMALSRQVPREMAFKIAQALVAESDAWAMAQAAVRGPIGPEFSEQSERVASQYADALAGLHDVAERFIHSTENVETVGDALRRVHERESRGQRE